MLQDNHASPAPYVPFITAVKSLIFHSLCQFDILIPLGPVLVNMTNGNLLNIEPSLSPFGDLILKIYHQQSNLFKLSHAIESCNASSKPLQIPSKIILSPIGIPASFISFIPPPKSVKGFVNLLMCSYGIKIEDTRLASMDWATFNISPQMANPIIISWPMDFCFCQPPFKHKTDNDLFWFRSNDIISQVETHMNDLQAIASLDEDYRNDNDKSNDNDSNDNKRLTNGLGLVSKDFTDSLSINLSENASHIFNSHLISQQPLRMNGMGPSIIYPTPPDPALRSRPDINEQDHAINDFTPGKSSKNWDDIEELFGDAQEITEDDFNFFDDTKEKVLNPIQEEQVNEPVPHSSEKEDIKSQSSASTNSSSFLWPMPFASSQTIEVKPSQGFEFENVSILSNLFTEEKRNNIFSPLKFHSSISNNLDSKYSRGGRYFVEPGTLEEEEEEDSDIEESDDDTCKPPENNLKPGGRPFEVKVALKTQPESPDLKRKLEEANLSETEDDIVSKKLATGWFNLLSQSRIVGKLSPLFFLPGVDIKASDSQIFDSTIEVLIHQVIWDDGIFSNIISSALVPRFINDVTLMDNLKALFPQLEQLHLSQVLSLADGKESNAIGSLPASGTNSPVSLNRQDSLSNHGNERLNSQSRPQSRSLLFPDSVEPSTNNYDVFTDSPKMNTQISGILPNSFSQTEQPVNPPALARPRPELKLLFSIDTPHYTMVRMNQTLKAKSPILRFWKVFGLEPKNGKKTLSVIMLSPGGKNSCKESAYFLQSLKGSYESSGLGTLTLLKSKSMFEGTIPVSYQGQNLDHALETMRQTIISLSRELKSEGSKPQNLVVIIADPFSSVLSLMAFSQAFVQFKREYLANEGNGGDNVILKIIPVEIFASCDSLNVPSQYKMVRFALDLYERCPVVGENALETHRLVSEGLRTQRRSPAFTLSRLPPNKINFNFSAKPSPLILDEDSFLHIAYSVSENRKWLVSSWSDQYGEISKVEAFCLMKAEGQMRLPEEVCPEIWQKTLGLISHLPVRWKITIAKLGRIDEDEVEMWKGFASSSGKKISSLYILSVNTKPSFMIRDGMFRDDDDDDDGSMFRMMHGGSRNGSGNGSGNGIGNGNGIGGIGGGSGEKDIGDDAVIIDCKNEIYGVLVKHETGSIGSFLTTFQAPTQLITGYLVKAEDGGRELGGGNKEENDGGMGGEVGVFEATLVHCCTSPGETMRAILVQYRHLASLGATTGVETRVGSISPWHVYAVDKALRVLLHIV